MDTKIPKAAITKTKPTGLLENRGLILSVGFRASLRLNIFPVSWLFIWECCCWQCHLNIGKRFSSLVSKATSFPKATYSLACTCTFQVAGEKNATILIDCTSIQDHHPWLPAVTIFPWAIDFPPLLAYLGRQPLKQSPIIPILSGIHSNPDFTPTTLLNHSYQFPISSTLFNPKVILPCSSCLTWQEQSMVITSSHNTLKWFFCCLWSLLPSQLCFFFIFPITKYWSFPRRRLLMFSCFHLYSTL